MIIVRIIGGVGNQLFQYSAGRRLALRHKTTLKIDPSPFKTYTLHDYRLDRFTYQAETATPEEVAPYMRLRGNRLKMWLLRRYPSLVLGKGALHYVRESLKHYDPGVLTMPDDVYLDGYWQSENYFRDAAEEVRSELQWKDPPDEENAAMLEKIAAGPAVSVHLRRGDYVTDPKVLSTFGICSLEYYHAALRYIAERVESPHFFIFSDDVDWARENLPGEFKTTFVSHNGRNRNVEDLRLMSSCRHHIIANSSFSWWGAWLNPRPDKMVLGPDPWFRDGTYPRERILPKEWIAVPNPPPPD